ncbi:DUF2726 domain-containing protein [Campylobacter sp. RM12327]|uniref:DUF2726 domain-containing protein n=1 Tax=Campylobacter sputorum TaxID=206 RepID=UPI000B77E188|nr:MULTISPECIES: DUF2726 domain-containing protein [Campylobacter]ASM40111.1 DUF2726 domain protein [Campylobacter sputorum]MBE7358752.1 DUF2726 domain-containing protein [Campylobacter sp. RM11302]MBF6670064.1 DUF2726 domain-containing protein [Campylobacter sp. RM12327]MBF6675192.1 DUF2726 domain-containing protein [Campylobacter sp. RM13538]MBF6676804.1 DUF2726 domain-containing protein [Campylobacter sp. RM12321]
MIDKKNIENSTVVRIQKDTFSKKSLLNQEEIKVYSALIKAINELGISGLVNINSQVNLSAFISSDIAYPDFNKLSVDFLITSKKTAEPLLVIEYYGGGHYGNEEEALKVENRDLIKLSIFAKVELPFKIICNSELDDIMVFCKNLLEKFADQCKENLGGDKQ